MLQCNVMFYAVADLYKFLRSCVRCFRASDRFRDGLQYCVFLQIVLFVRFTHQFANTQIVTIVLGSVCEKRGVYIAKSWLGRFGNFVNAVNHTKTYDLSR